MVSVKSDKRTVRITKKSVLHKKIDSSKLIGFIGENFRQHHYRRSTDGNLDVDRAINDGIHSYMQYEGYYSIAFPNEESEEIDFVNFEDVIEKLSKKLELKYKEELVDLRKAKEVYQLNTITLKKEHEIAISSIEQRLRETEKELEGVIFDNGKVCVCWKIKDKPSSVVVWDTLDDFKKISLTNKKRELLFIQD